MGYRPTSHFLYAALKMKDYIYQRSLSTILDRQIATLYGKAQEGCQAHMQMPEALAMHDRCLCLQVQEQQQGGICSGRQRYAPEDRGQWAIMEEGQVHRWSCWKPICSKIHPQRQRLHSWE